MSNCSLNVRRTLVSTAAKSTLFVTTPDGSQTLPNVSIVATEMTPIGLILIADIYISISMGTFGHRKYKSRGEDGNK